jgi:hypothetical protein
MTTFINKYKTKYPDFVFSNTSCKSNRIIDIPQIDPTKLDKIEDTQFFLKNHNYVNVRNNDGSIKAFSGVCNPKLLDKCDSDNNPGICSPSIYNDSYKILIDTKEQDSLSSYQTFLHDNPEPTFNKLPSDHPIINDEHFANLYCESGKLTEKENEFRCL